ncbi:IS66 family transposase [Methylocystis sp. L43]|jgi:transposase|uniref:IS66 family transposase n=1 Tax=Methylocystis rosea TaxID=173366 RepID=A0ABX6ENU3_9HYPH|nr:MULTISPECIES: IS66 family transposase [Methylocystis]MBG0797208.1 IS66 family transposase [Methylocystis sp. L43]MBG0804186.1 IS66 family transposase [Methylocystis sp. H15]PWB89024.1 IS66 family transposase [Methylocystis sp. MitZ-2018]QGM96005.1 IS66 family transposase [Methylocystis rosea]
MAQAIERLPDDPNELKAMLLAERARNERLVQIIKEMQRHRFGRRAETLPEDQMLLALEEVDQTEAGAAAAAEAKSAAEREKAARKRRTNRGALPAHLPRIETIVDIDEKACPCCKGALHRIGEDVSERLDIVPAQFRVLVTRRPKYACRACEGAVVQAPAPARLIEGGLPTEATVAHVLVSKYADHLPLYRQAQIYARQGIALDRSTLADWVGRAAWHLRPVHERLLEHIRLSTKIFADETKAPVLDPGRGRTKTGQLWAYARDDRPFGGADPPIAVYVYAQNRKSEQPLTHLAGFTGVVQVDGYAGYRALAQKNSVSLAFCWSHVRRRFYELAAAGPAPIASEALERIGALYAVESNIRGQNPDDRRAARQEKSRPILDALEPWLREKLTLISQKTKLAEAIRYALSRWDGLTRFVDDGRIEIDSNIVERAIRPITMRESLCIPSSSICKHWKRVFVDDATRATFTGNRRFNRLQRQIFGADLMRRARNHLYCWKRAGFDQASYRVVCDA